MADVHTKIQRSKNMTAVKSRNNKSTELAFKRILERQQIIGWRRHVKVCGYTPDFIFPEQKLSIFIDGCFWHKCKKCFIKPKTNEKFWDKKISDNVKRDIKIDKKLIKFGWKSIHVWEHEIKKDIDKSAKIKKIQKIIEK